MSIPQNVRASDRSDFTNTKRNDFVKRKPEISGKQIYSLCLMLLIIVIGVSVLVYNDAQVGSGLCVVVGSVLWFFARHIERGQKQLQATQFLNAMFASVLATQHKFVMIVKEDGEIVYLDRAFQEMFPDVMHGAKRTLDMLFESYHVSLEDRAALVAMLTNGKTASIPFTIEGGGEHQKHVLTLSCEPVPRPAGFFLLRGR